MEFDVKAFSNILKTLCDSYNTITAFAQRTHIDRTYLAKYINAKLKRPPSPGILKY